jgi:hypothetical protein
VGISLRKCEEKSEDLKAIGRFCWLELILLSLYPYYTLLASLNFLVETNSKTLSSPYIFSSILSSLFSCGESESLWSELRLLTSKAFIFF